MPKHIIENRTSIRVSPVLGRYLITQSATKAHDILIEELPFALGPKCNSAIVCLGCYVPLKCNNDGPLERCPICKWPLCIECSERITDCGDDGSDCNGDGAKVHKNNECDIFRVANVKFYELKNDYFGCPQLDCITVLRYILFLLIYILKNVTYTL